MASLGRSVFWQLVVVLTISISAAPRSQAVGWFDDFNDGSVTDGDPVSWASNPYASFNGNYDPSSGDYALSAPGDGADDSILVTWVDGISFTDTYIRAQGIILPGALPEEVGGNLVLLGRLDEIVGNAYILYLNENGSLGLQFSASYVIADVVPAVSLTELSGTSDVVIELNIIGNELSGYAWRPDQQKPATPQITATIADPVPIFASGDAGLAYAENDDNTIGVFRYATAQDTPFVDTLPGDYNTDGKVDAADYTVWRDGLGGEFEAADYDVWVANFGAGTGSATGATAVPEPSGLLWAVPALIAAAYLRKHKVKT